MSEYMKQIEELLGAPTREAVELQLKRKNETIVDFYQCAESEHSWHNGTSRGRQELLERQMAGHMMVLKNEKGEERSITLRSYIFNIMEEWKEYLENKKVEK